MGYAILIGLVAIVVVIIWVTKANATRQREHYARLLAEARQFMETVEQRRTLPSVPTNIMLKSGERAFYSAPSALYETVAVRQYQSGGAGFRVAKGVYIGGSRGRSISTQEWSKIDAGSLTVTNKRLIFDGGSADRSVMLNKIISVNPSLNGVEISVENRKKSMVVEAVNPLILGAIIHICSRVDDPLDLSQDTLDITFS